MGGGTAVITIIYFRVGPEHLGARGDYRGRTHCTNANRRERRMRTLIDPRTGGKVVRPSRSKVIIHTRRRKFLSKPKGSAPAVRFDLQTIA